MKKIKGYNYNPNSCIFSGILKFRTKKRYSCIFEFPDPGAAPSAHPGRFRAPKSAKKSRARDWKLKDTDTKEEAAKIKIHFKDKNDLKVVCYADPSKWFHSGFPPDPTLIL